MPNYTFTFTKTFDLTVEAQTDHEAWLQAMSFTPDSMPSDWDIQIKGTQVPKEVPIDQGPCEIDEWDPPQFDD